MPENRLLSPPRSGGQRSDTPGCGIGCQCRAQRAMDVAMTYPEPKRGKYSESRNGTGEVSKQRLSAARTVLKWAPELGDGVLNGAHLNGTVPSRFRARKHQTLLAFPNVNARPRTAGGATPPCMAARAFGPAVEPPRSGRRDLGAVGMRSLLLPWQGIQKPCPRSSPRR